MASSVAVVVAAGGTSRRFGSDKLALLLDGTLASLPADVGPVVCVGPPRPTPSRADVVWTREVPPGGGPLAAVAAGLALVPADARAVVLVGGDMPSVGRAVWALVAALDGAGDGVGGGVGDEAGVAVLVADGRPQPLASAWRRSALVAAVTRVREAADGDVAGAAVRLLLAEVDAYPVPDVWGAGVDVDEPGDLGAG